jgi:hypothetical protein
VATELAAGRAELSIGDDGTARRAELSIGGDATECPQASQNSSPSRTLAPHAEQEVKIM